MSSNSGNSFFGSSNNVAMVVVAVVLFVSGFFIGQLWQENQMLKNGVSPSANQANPSLVDDSGTDLAALANMPELSQSDHVRGSENPKITLVEYSDFECPFCNRFHPTMTQIMEKFGDDVMWVYRHLPLSFHPFAQRSAEASECVAEQMGVEGFWKFADHIFGKQSDGATISNDLIDEAAKVAGVNMKTYQECLESGRMADLVNTMASGASLTGINGTPGTVVVTQDGPQELIPGALPYEQVEQILKKYL